jgi:hypothetical protein
MEIEQLEQVCREKSKEIYLSEHGKTKSDCWICGDILLPNGKETKCEECGVVCYYDTKLKVPMKRKSKKICMKCALENHSEDLTALEQDILKRAVEIKK